MPVISLFTMVLILGGSTPGVEVVPEHFTKQVDCDADVLSRKGAPPMPGFGAHGEPIIATFYYCQPFIASTLLPGAELLGLVK